MCFDIRLPSCEASKLRHILRSGLYPKQVIAVKQSPLTHQWGGDENWARLPWSKRESQNFNFGKTSRRVTQVWLKGTVLKTVRRIKACVGSNPTSSFVKEKTLKLTSIEKSEPRRRAMLVRGSLKSLERLLFVFIGKPVGDCARRWHPANFKRVRL